MRFETVLICIHENKRKHAPIAGRSAKIHSTHDPKEGGLATALPRTKRNPSIRYRSCGPPGRGLKLVGPLGIRDLSILHFSEEQTVVRHRYRPILIYLSDYHPMAWRVHL